MKILVVQIARFGDIVLTIPILRALSRQYPQSELHSLVRTRFMAAMEGVDCCGYVHQLDTESILAPIFSNVEATTESLSRLDKFKEGLVQEKFDLIINLSFSPFSSYLVHAITGENSRVHGYTRFGDGYFRPMDPGSTYFYAQVGINKANRLHVLSLFSWVAQVDIVEEDFDPPVEQCSSLESAKEVLSIKGEEYFVIHFGASEEHKIWAINNWVQLLTESLRFWDGKIVILGAKEENAPWIDQGFSHPRLVNLMGKTKIISLYSICQEAKFVVGGDSLLMHIAALSRTPCLNLSFCSVNFWETGPISKSSCIVRASSSNELDVTTVLESLINFINNNFQDDTQNLIRRSNYVWDGWLQPLYYSRREKETEWKIIQSLYFEYDGEFQMTKDSKLGLEKLADLARLMLSQIEVLTTNQGQVQTILDSMTVAEKLFEKIERLCPELLPLTSWLGSQKVQIGPGNVTEIMSETKNMYLDFIGRIAKISKPKLGRIGNELNKGVEF